ncbi:MAG: phosphoadenylyl-sulfate reductase [Rhizobiaceae bacterium]|nr:phosphoadenylyl-sulfate reductase [Rhizobiaceae bacterium]
MLAKPEPPEGSATSEIAAGLNARYGGLAPQDIIRVAVENEFAGAVGAVSSFGADSAVLLHMLAEVDPTVPVVFLDTGQHFGETLAYRDALAVDFGLRDLRVIHPDETALAAVDPDGMLHMTDTDTCCAVRKVEPMARAVAPFRAWFTGRKRFQAATRNGLQPFEPVGPRIRINPLAAWGTAELAAYMREKALRENPLVAYGYLSIGCFPCTQPVAAGADARSGRWAGQAKTECGIHLSGLEQSLTDASL